MLASSALCSNLFTEETSIPAELFQNSPLQNLMLSKKEALIFDFWDKKFQKAIIMIKKH